MLSKEDLAVIKALKKRGVYTKDIAAELDVHPRTVSRALKRDGPPSGKRKKRGSKLDRFKPNVDDLLAKNVWNAKVILREIEAEGYQGGITILRDYIRPKRVLRPGRATVRFETKPGRQLQSDWGQIRTEIGGVAARNPALTSGFWIWRTTTGLQPGPASRGARGRRGRMSAWSATLRATSLSAIARLTVGLT
jgi:transposase